jgi:hypothetical protein
LQRNSFELIKDHPLLKLEMGVNIEKCGQEMKAPFGLFFLYKNYNFVQHLARSIHEFDVTATNR